MRGCLEKNPKQRVGDIRDVRRAMQGAFDIPTGPPSEVPSASVAAHPAWRRALPWVAAAVLTIGAGIAAWTLKPADERPFAPFFSPDGESVGYFQGTLTTVGAARLMRVAVTGGVPVALAETSNVFGASWGSDGTILYGQPDGIWHISASGRYFEPVAATLATSPSVISPMPLVTCCSPYRSTSIVWRSGDSPCK